jgi:hypothetical protein
MNKLLTFIVILCGFHLAEAKAFDPGSQINCWNHEGHRFSIEIKKGGTLRVAPYDDAIIRFESGAYNWHWMKLESSNIGRLISQYTYKILSGGDLIVSETVKLGRGGCGRGLCEDNFEKKVLAAKLISSFGQASLYACAQKN